MSVSLVSELDEVKENENFYIGLRFIIKKDWHIYWKNPGDSGTSPRVKWRDGLSIGAIDWPYPKKISFVEVTTPLSTVIETSKFP